MKNNPAYFDPIEYIQEIIDEYNSIKNTNLFDKKEYEIAFNLISANLAYFLPNLPFEQHEKFGKSVKWHQSWAQIDQNYLHLVDSTKIFDEHQILKKINNKNPAIFCTFHLGSYRLLNFILISKKIPFTLITDSNYINTQGEFSSMLFKNAQNKYYEDTPPPIEILNAENPNIAFEASRKLKSGNSLLFYIDGNTGVGGVLHDKRKNVKVDFLNKEIYARKGIAFISYLTKTPIIPVINFRTGWLSRETHFFNTIEPSKESSRNAYLENSTKELYSIFEEYLKKYPEQWEGWFYIHKFIEQRIQQNNLDIFCDNKDYSLNDIYKFNNEDYGLMDYNVKKCLLHKRTFEVSIIDLDLFNTLSIFKLGKRLIDMKINAQISETQLKELINLNLIKRI